MITFKLYIVYIRLLCPSRFYRNVLTFFEQKWSLYTHTVGDSNVALFTMITYCWFPLEVRCRSSV